MAEKKIESAPLTYAQAKQLVMQWKRAAPLLEAQRERDIRDSDTARDIGVFDGLFEDAVARFPPGPESGLVEMHRYFKRLPRATARPRLEAGQ